jgi:hypothetical protein
LGEGEGGDQPEGRGQDRLFRDSHHDGHTLRTDGVNFDGSAAQGSRIGRSLAMGVGFSLMATSRGVFSEAIWARLSLTASTSPLICRVAKTWPFTTTGINA